jgi:hypothetical protein
MRHDRVRAGNFASSEASRIAVLILRVFASRARKVFLQLRRVHIERFARVLLRLHSRGGQFRAKVGV